MPESKGPPFYDIEYATAHHEAVTARAKAGNYPAHRRPHTQERAPGPRREDHTRR